MTINIEHLQLDELKSFLRIQADEAFPDLKDEQRLAMLAEKWHKYAEFCTSRDESDQLVGMIAFYANRPQSGVAYITHVFIDQHFRRRGIFGRLFRKLKDYVGKKGYAVVRLEVSKANSVAVVSYLRKGFVIKEEASLRSVYMDYLIQGIV